MLWGIGGPGNSNNKGKNASPVEVIQEGPAPPADPPSTKAEPEEGNVVGWECVEIPEARRAKLTLKDPRLADVRDACEQMHQRGVPDDAVIGFHKWNIPKDNYYLIATWSPHDGGRHQK